LTGLMFLRHTQQSHCKARRFSAYNVHATLFRAVILFEVPPRTAFMCLRNIAKDRTHFIFFGPGVIDETDGFRVEVTYWSMKVAQSVV